MKEANLLISFLKEKWFESIFCVLIASLILFKDYVIDRIIVPEIIEQLLSEKYLRNEFKLGNFVVTDKQSFVENHPINSEVLLKLNNGMYLEHDELLKYEIKSNKYLDGLETNINNQKNYYDNHIKTLIQENLELKIKVDNLEELTDVLSSHKMRVSLFISDIEEDKGHIILNVNNSAIAKTIIDGEDYKIQGSDGNRVLEVRLDKVTAPEFSKNSAIGRIYREDFHKIFRGQSGGLGKAVVVID